MSLHRYVGLIRALLVLAGLALFAGGLETVASAPMAPPEGDGFLDGLAFLNAIVVGTLGLFVVQIGYVLPAGTGRLRVGPLADRSAALRGGVAVLAYLLLGVVMVYGVPHLVPAVKESTTYAAGLFAFVIAAGLGTVLTVVLALGKMARKLIGEL